MPNYYEADGLGSATSLSGSSGTISASYVYDTFGNLSSSTGSVTNAIRYAGREFEVDVDIYNFRSRYYVAPLGRFLEEDTVRFRGGANFYDYVKNNASNLIDPLGEQGSGGGIPNPDSKSKKYNCLAWGLGITTGWVQPDYFFQDPNSIPRKFKCKQVDCDTQVDCGKKHRMNIYVDPYDPWNWHVERQMCDGWWSSKNGQSYLYWGINDPDIFYKNHYFPKGPIQKTCWLCPGQ